MVRMVTGWTLRLLGALGAITVGTCALAAQGEPESVQVVVNNRCAQAVVLLVHHLHADGQMATHGLQVASMATAGPVSHMKTLPLFFFATSNEYTWSGEAKNVDIQGRKIGFAEAKLKPSGSQLVLDLECSTENVFDAEEKNIAYRYAPDMMKSVSYVGPLASADGMWVCTSCRPERYLVLAHDSSSSIDFYEKDHWDDDILGGHVQLLRDRSFVAVGYCPGIDRQELKAPYELKGRNLVALHGGEIFLNGQGEMVFKNMDILGRRVNREFTYRRLSASEVQAYEGRTKKFKTDRSDAFHSWSVCVLDAAIKPGARSQEDALNIGMAACRSQERALRAVLDSAYGRDGAEQRMEQTKSEIRENARRPLSQIYRS